MASELNPKISVIMSVYNGEEYLEESIQSIVNQTFKDFEFIIINDCSTDNSLKIIKRYAQKDNRIKLINNTKNIGLTISLNKSLHIATGKYIARQDCDDISLRTRLQVQYNFLETHPDTFLCGSSVLIIDDNSRLISLREALTGVKTIRMALKQNNCIVHPSIMFRNNKQIFYRDKFKYAQDYDLYLRLLSENKRLENIKQPLIKYRINSKSISIKKLTQQNLFAKKSKKFYKQRIKYGKDNYEGFNSLKILNIKKRNSLITKEKIIIEELLNGGCNKKARKMIKRLLEIKKIQKENQNLFKKYYLISFLPHKLFKLIKKIKAFFQF